MLETYLATLEMGYFEVTEAFRDLTDENVWERPAENLLSIGEMAGHVAYWEAVRFAGDGGGNPPDLAKCRITSPLIDHRFSYYSGTIESLPSDEQRDLTAQQVCDELVRVHKAVVAALRERNPDMKSLLRDDTAFPTYEQALQYAIFHVSYHTGQMYSARHLLGETPPDN